MTLPAFAAERRRKHVPIDLSAQLSSKALQPHVPRGAAAVDRRDKSNQIKYDFNNG